MNRIMVTGVSAGVGKSTFARKLGEKLNITVYHLDTLYWKPNWIESSVKEFSARQQEIFPEEQWIIEGNYSNTYELRAKHADTIIYLELPLSMCLFRVFKRLVVNLERTRPDMAEGCKEKIDYQFIKFICTTYFPRKKKMIARFQAFQEIGPHKTIITLKSRKEIQAFLDKLST